MSSYWTVIRWFNISVTVKVHKRWEPILSPELVPPIDPYLTELKRRSIGADNDGLRKSLFWQEHTRKKLGTYCSRPNNGLLDCVLFSSRKVGVTFLLNLSEWCSKTVAYLRWTSSNEHLPVFARFCKRNRRVRLHYWRMDVSSQNNQALFISSSAPSTSFCRVTPSTTLQLNLAGTERPCGCLQLQCT
jgi:hypothetical protein